MPKLNSTILSIFLMTGFGCKKLPESSKLLVGKTWREAQVMVKPNANMDKPLRDITDHFPDTDQDDVLIFFRNGKYKWDEGTSKAASATQQVYQSGTWSLEASTQLLILSSDDSITSYEIIKISENQLVLKLPYKEDPINFHFELVYQAKP